MGEEGRARVGRGREERIGEGSVVESQKILKMGPAVGLPWKNLWDGYWEIVYRPDALAVNSVR